MDINEYQERAHETSEYKDSSPQEVVYSVLGLVSESGEVAQILKRLIRRGESDIDEDAKEAISTELGDVMWYVAEICSRLDIDLESVAEDNLDKLEDRKERGTLFGSGDSR